MGATGYAADVVGTTAQVAARTSSMMSCRQHEALPLGRECGLRVSKVGTGHGHHPKRKATRSCGRLGSLSDPERRCQASRTMRVSLPLSSLPNLADVYVDPPPSYLRRPSQLAFESVRKDVLL